MQDLLQNLPTLAIGMSGIEWFVEAAGATYQLRLERVNYAAVHIISTRLIPSLQLRANGQLVDRHMTTGIGVNQIRSTWVLPAEWNYTFPSELEVVAKGGAVVARIKGTNALGFGSHAAPIGEAQLRHRAPFPADVIALVNALGHEHFDSTSFWAAERISQFIEELWSLRRLLGRSGYAEPLAKYFGFLLRSDAANAFALTNFPDVNSTAVRKEKAHGIATHPDEMLAMMHHLYVLKSVGLGGAFAEFGCFKGFSTSCLSRGCAELGVPMHVFDSFAGLPPSSSRRYLEGEYGASFEEVERNVSMFGDPRVITWHKGFFSNTLDGFGAPLNAIWMDVDLKESSGDVMRCLGLVDGQGCIFSHEMSAQSFVEGGAPNEQALAAGRFEVLPPIVEAIRDRSFTFKGEHIIKSLGVVYLPDSVQVLPHCFVVDLLFCAKGKPLPPRGFLRSYVATAAMHLRRWFGD
jgi:hypothetical protein